MGSSLSAGRQPSVSQEHLDVSGITEYVACVAAALQTVPLMHWKKRKRYKEWWLVEKPANDHRSEQTKDYTVELHGKLSHINDRLPVMTIFVEHFSGNRTIEEESVKLSYNYDITRQFLFDDHC
jgi:hypothetical protein